MKKPMGVYPAGVSLIGLSLLACINIVISVAFYSRSRPEYLSAFSSVTDAAYGVLLYGLGRLTGWLIFPLYLIGAQVIILVFLGISGFFLIKGNDRARRFLVVFSIVSLVFWVLETPSIMKQGVLLRMCIAWAALLFHGFIAVYLSLPGVKALFRERKTTREG